MEKEHITISIICVGKKTYKILYLDINLFNIVVNPMILYKVEVWGKFLLDIDGRKLKTYNSSFDITFSW